MQSGHLQYQQAIPQSANKIQESFELYSWLDDMWLDSLWLDDLWLDDYWRDDNILPVEEPLFALSYDQSMPGPILSSPTDDIKHEVDIPNSSAIVSLDCVGVVRSVPPSPSPAKTTAAALPETVFFNLENEVPSSLQSSKRRLPSEAATHLVSDASDDEEITTRSPKRQRKAQLAATSVVMVPADVDILLGRGKPFQNHVGNQRMLNLVDNNRERYHQTERKEKHDMIEKVIGIISGSGGRFLRRVDHENYWVEVNHTIAYRKVGHAFRSKVRKNG